MADAKKIIDTVKEKGHDALQEHGVRVGDPEVSSAFTRHRIMTNAMVAVNALAKKKGK